jgi:hypothetical protein
VLIATSIFSLTPLTLVLLSESEADTSFVSEQFSQAFMSDFSASSAIKALVSAAFLRSIGIVLSRIGSTLFSKILEYNCKCG